MDPRKQSVLQAIVALYALDGEPVGSGLLSRYLDMAFSSATLRNEMAALTKLGLLEQPHTSAGRVPSAKGYRYYLDHLLEQPEHAPTAQRHRIDEVFRTLDYEPERLAQGAARALSEITGCASVVTTPAAQEMCIAHFEVVQVGRYSAAVLAVTAHGGVHTRVARIETGLSRADAATLAMVLNRRLTFVSPEDLSLPLLTEIANELGAQSQTLWPVVLAAASLLQDAAQSRTYLEGQQYLVQWPELTPYLAQLFALCQEPELQQLITPPNNRVQVALGEDLAHAIPGLCIMSKRYLAGGGLAGGIALVGPTRMPLPQLIPCLEYFALKLGQSMSGNTQEDAR